MLSINNMEFKRLLNDVKIPILGVGTWMVGGDIEIDVSKDPQYIESLKYAISLGMTHIDTAELYAKGHTEELVGEAIKDFNRKDLFITSKVSPENLNYDNVINSCKKSLERLKTGYLDLYLIHYPNPNISLKETMSAMDELVKKKLVRFIGVSNFSVEKLKEVQGYSKNKIVANQIEYNLLIRNSGQFTMNIEARIIPYCMENDILIIAYRPLAKGRLGKPGIKLIDELCNKYKKTPAQISLNWLISKNNIITIPKAINQKHIEENSKSIGWKLDKEDILKLDNKFKDYVL